MQVRETPTRVGRRGAPAVALLALTGLAAAAVWVPSPTSWRGFQESLGSAVPTPAAAALPAPGSAEPGSPDPTASVAQPTLPPSDRPTPAGRTVRLATAPPAPVGGGSHAFVAFQANGVTPIAYDPCRPVHYVIRPDNMPAGGEEMVHAAAGRITQATGLQFVYDGATDEPVTEHREPYQPDRYGDRWAPVLVAWQTDTENAELAGGVVGLGGSTSMSFGVVSTSFFVSGIVVLDGGQFPDVVARSGPEVAQAIVVHEFGHLVGLDHVADESQLMNPETVPGITDFAAGDLEGLARLGRGSCAPHL